MWHSTRVGPFRKAAGIRYPQAYAESSDIASAKSEDQKHAMYLFNCAQRAHANYLENHASAALAILIAGLQYPLTSSVLGAGWAVSRLAYAIGYTRKDRTDGKGRLVGMTFMPFQLALFSLSAWVGIKMVI